MSWRDGARDSDAAAVPQGSALTSCKQPDDVVTNAAGGMPAGDTVRARVNLVQDNVRQVVQDSLVVADDLDVYQVLSYTVSGRGGPPVRPMAAAWGSAAHAPRGAHALQLVPAHSGSAASAACEDGGGGAAACPPGAPDPRTQVTDEAPDKSFDYEAGALNMSSITFLTNICGQVRSLSLVHARMCTMP